MPRIRPTIVESWDVLDRADGVEVRVRFKRGGERKINLADDDARALAETLQRVLDAEDRPLSGRVGGDDGA